MRLLAWVWSSALTVIVAGCSGSPVPTVQRPYIDGVRQRPLTTEEAEGRLRRAAPTFESCYRREMINLTEKLSSYIFRVWIPTDGSGAEVKVLKATVKGQVTLRECLEEAIARVRFPAHVGEPITLRVPIKGPA